MSGTVCIASGLSRGRLKLLKYQPDHSAFSCDLLPGAFQEPGDQNGETKLYLNGLE